MALRGVCITQELTRNANYLSGAQQQAPWTVPPDSDAPLSLRTTAVSEKQHSYPEWIAHSKAAKRIKVFMTRKHVIMCDNGC